MSHFIELPNTRKHNEEQYIKWPGAPTSKERIKKACILQISYTMKTKT